MFSYSKTNSNSSLIFNPKELNVRISDFVEYAWSDFYAGAQEAIPPNAPKPLGKGITSQLFVDSNHAGDKVS